MTVTTILELKNILNPQGNMVYNVLGYYKAGDGGGGDFYWDATDSSSDENAGTIFTSFNQTNGRWKRIYDRALNVKWFGATGLKEKPDYIPGYTDDSPAINKCLDYARTAFGAGGKIVFPKGEYRISDTVNFTGMEFLEIVGEGAWLYPIKSMTAVNIQGSRLYYMGLNISFELAGPGIIDENAVAIWLHKNGQTAQDQVNNSIFEFFSVIAAHTGIKSQPNHGLVWHLDFRSIYFDLYEGISAQKAIAFDIESSFNLGGSTTIKLTKCAVQSFITNRPDYPRGKGYSGYKLYYSSDVYIEDCSFDGYLDSRIQLDESGQIMDIFSRNIHINGFHCEALNNTMDANYQAAPFKLNSTGFAEIKNIIILESQMNCGGSNKAGAWFIYYGGGPLNFGTYTDNGIVSIDGTNIYVLTLCNQQDGDDVTNSRSQINFSNAIKPSQVHLLDRNYNSIHFDSLEVNGLVTSINSANPATILSIPSSRCSFLLAVRGFSQIDGSVYFIDYVLISRSRNNTVKVKNLISDSNNYSGITNTYSVTPEGDIRLARTAAVPFWVTAKVVNMI